MITKVASRVTRVVAIWAATFAIGLSISAPLLLGASAAAQTDTSQTPSAQVDPTQTPTDQTGQSTSDGSVDSSQATNSQNEITQGLCAGVNLNIFSNCSNGGISGPELRQKFEDIAHTIINLFSLLVGFVAVIMIIVGGFKYITSGGDSSNISNAKNTIIYAIIGIIIVALSQFMVRFILSRVVM